MYALKKLGKISSFFDFLGGGSPWPPPMGNRDIESPWEGGLRNDKWCQGMTMDVKECQGIKRDIKKLKEMSRVDKWCQGMAKGCHGMTKGIK